MFQTLQVNINKQKKEAFQIIKPDLDVDPESNPHFDEGMGVDKTKLLRPKRMSFQFVEEGKWTREAEHIKLKVFSVAFKPVWIAYMNSMKLFFYNYFSFACRVNLEKRKQKSTGQSRHNWQRQRQHLI